MAFFHEFNYVPDRSNGFRPFCTPYGSVRMVIQYNNITKNHYKTKLKATPWISNYLEFDHYLFMLFLIQFLIPLVILSLSYVKMAIILWFKKTPGNPDIVRDKNLTIQRKKSVKMMIAVLVSFGLCWLPWHLFFACHLLFPSLKRYKALSVTNNSVGSRTATASNMGAA